MKRAFLFTLLISIISFSMKISAQWETPLLYYQFDQSEGNILADSSGNSFHSTASCSDCWVSDGKFSGSYHFKGDETIQLPAGDMGLTNANGTVAFWILLSSESASSINTFWWAGESGGDTFGPQNEMHINTEATENNIWLGGEIAFYIQDSLADDRYFLFSDPSKGSNPATVPSENAITLTDDTWHHLTCTWEKGGAVGLYIDGEAVWDTTSYNPNTWECKLMTLGGANERTNRRLTGYLDEFRIYDHALDLSEIEALFAHDPEASSVSIENPVTHKPGLKLYPNPAKEMLYLSNIRNVKLVEIYSLTGQKVLTQAIHGEPSVLHVNIDQLVPGVYFLRSSEAGKDPIYKKFIKE